MVTRTILFFLLAIVVAADFYCENDTVRYDEPTAILTDGTVRVVNCSLYNVSVWCDDCDMEVRDNQFYTSPCPALAAVFSHSFPPIPAVEGNRVSCQGIPSTHVIRSSFSEDNSSLPIFMNACDYPLYFVIKKAAQQTALDGTLESRAP